MRTLLCVPIFVDNVDAALDDTALAKEKGADLVELRTDRFFSGSACHSSPTDACVLDQLHRLLAQASLPVILTCRPAWEGGEYEGDEADRIAALQRLCLESAHPPAYLDIELAAYTRNADVRRQIDPCVMHPRQQRDVPTRLILSIHDFHTRPPDLDRKLLAAYDAPACSVVKLAYRARSLRDNLDLFEITRTAPKPTVALGMGEFGLMSRVLAPKFGGFLTFASLRDESATAPGQPTIHDLLEMYRFRKIGKSTKLYGVIGWPVRHSLSPLIHNAGFEAVGWDGVYLPMPIAADEKDAAASYASFKATMEALAGDRHLDYYGASITLPHKENLARLGKASGWVPPHAERHIGALNTYYRNREYDSGSLTMMSSSDAWPVDAWPVLAANTDYRAIVDLLHSYCGNLSPDQTVAIIGAGGVGRAAAFAACRVASRVWVLNRNEQRACELADSISRHLPVCRGDILPRLLDVGDMPDANVYINCTPVGMVGGPDPDGLSIPIPDMANIDENTVFFDTVYNPALTPMLKAAKARGCRTIDGIEMFVRQAATQFELWTANRAPANLFDKLCRDRMSRSD